MLTLCFIYFARRLSWLGCSVRSGDVAQRENVLSPQSADFVHLDLLISRLLKYASLARTDPKPSE